MSEVPLERVEPEGRLHALYQRAGDFELELERAVAHDPNARLTEEQADRFNTLLHTARELITNSIALKEDSDDMETTTRAADAHRVMHLTVVPTLHNALPPELAAR